MIPGAERTAGDWCDLLFDGAPGTVLFRVDAGRVEGLSFGHLSRCLTLARLIHSEGGGPCHFLMRDYPEGLRAAKAGDVPVTSFSAGVSPSEEAAAIDAASARLDVHWIIVDLPYPDADYSWIDAQRERKMKILFLDDARFDLPAVDVAWNSSVLAPGRLRSENPEARILAGPEFFLFETTDDSARAVRTEGRRNILLTFGGSDPTGVTARAVEALRSKPWPGARFRVILGPGFAETQEIRDRVDGDPQWDAIENPTEMSPYMTGCDLAVCNGGRTLYELWRLGRRALPIATAPHEREAIEAFVRQGLVGDGLPVWEREAFLSSFSHAFEALKNGTEH